MTNRVLLIVVALFGILPVSARSRNTIFNREHMNVAVQARRQHMLNTHDIYNDVLDSYNSILKGVQVGFDTHSSDSSWWANAYNYPSLSLGFSYDNAGSMNTKPGTNIGDFYNLFLATEFDFFRAGIFSVGPVLELGISYSTDKYSPRSNISNTFVGSKILADLSAGLEASVLFHPHWEFSLTGYLVHHSTGMTQVPNLGTYQSAVGTKLKYYLAAQETDKRLQLDKPDFPEGLKWNIYTAFGGHRCDWELNAKGPAAYPVPFRLRAILGSEMLWRYHRMLSTGLGIEGNYADNAYREMDILLRGEEDPQGYSPFYTSVHFVQNFHYSNLSASFAFGVYTFKKTGLVEDIGKCFQRIGLRYHLPPFKTGQMFVGMGMRAHYFDRSYCIEYATGITF